MGNTRFPLTMTNEQRAAIQEEADKLGITATKLILSRVFAAQANEAADTETTPDDFPDTPAESGGTPADDTTAGTDESGDASGEVPADTDESDGAGSGAPIIDATRDLRDDDSGLGPFDNAEDMEALNPFQKLFEYVVKGGDDQEVIDSFAFEMLDFTFEDSLKSDDPAIRNAAKTAKSSCSALWNLVRRKSQKEAANG